MSNCALRSGRLGGHDIGVASEEVDLLLQESPGDSSLDTIDVLVAHSREQWLSKNAAAHDDLLQTVAATSSTKEAAQSVPSEWSQQLQKERSF